jgi:hypothetical protein
LGLRAHFGILAATGILAGIWMLRARALAKGLDRSGCSRLLSGAPFVGEYADPEKAA